MPYFQKEMNNIKINLEGISDSVLITSTLKALEVFNLEITNLQSKLSEKEGEICKLSTRVSEQTVLLDSLKSENQNLRDKTDELKEENTLINNKFVEEQKKTSEVARKINRAHADELLEKERELQDRVSAFDKEVKEMNNLLTNSNSENEKLKEDIKHADFNCLSLLLLIIENIAEDVSKLSKCVDNEALREWIESILTKKDTSELKGLFAFQTVESLDKLIRNLIFENSSFSEVATLIFWSHNSVLRKSITLDYDWGKLQTSFDLFIKMLDKIGYSVSYPIDSTSSEWLKTASSSVNRQEQDRFIKLFGESPSFENGMPMFISSLGIKSIGLTRDGSFIRFYLPS